MLITYIVVNGSLSSPVKIGQYVLENAGGKLQFFEAYSWLLEL